MFKLQLQRHLRHRRPPPHNGITHNVISNRRRSPRIRCPGSRTARNNHKMPLQPKPRRILHEKSHNRRTQHNKPHRSQRKAEILRIRRTQTAISTTAICPAGGKAVNDRLYTNTFCIAICLHGFRCTLKFPYSDWREQ